MGRRSSALLLLVAGYAALAALGPTVAAVPALLSFLSAVLLLAREPESAAAR